MPFFARGLKLVWRNSGCRPPTSNIATTARSCPNKRHFSVVRQRVAGCTWLWQKTGAVATTASRQEGVGAHRRAHHGQRRPMVGWDNRGDTRTEARWNGGLRLRPTVDGWSWLPMQALARKDGLRLCCGRPWQGLVAAWWQSQQRRLRGGGGIHVVERARSRPQASGAFESAMANKIPRCRHERGCWIGMLAAGSSSRGPPMPRRLPWKIRAKTLAPLVRKDRQQSGAPWRRLFLRFPQTS